MYHNTPPNQLAYILIYSLQYTISNLHIKVLSNADYLFFLHDIYSVYIKFGDYKLFVEILGGSFPVLVDRERMEKDIYH